MLPAGSNGMRVHHFHLPAGYVDLHVRSEPAHHRHRIDTPLELTQQEQFLPKNVIFGAGTVCDVGKLANFGGVDFFDLLGRMGNGDC